MNVTGSVLFRVTAYLNGQVMPATADGQFVFKACSECCSGGGRTLTSAAHDEILFDWIIYERSEHNRVTRQMIVSWGRELAKDMEIPLVCSNY